MRPIANCRPLIGIPCGMFPDLWYPPTHGNAISYLRAIEAAGGIPSLIHLTDDADVLDVLYDRCDALLFAGGEDIAPAAYDAVPHPKLGTTNQQQDHVEIALVRRAIAEGRPVLGICRGLQIINVALGGTLYQDIAAECPNTLDHQASDARYDMAYLAHPIEIDAASWLAEQLGTSNLLVNTLHHQAVRDLAPTMRVVACAPDAVVEAIEGRGDQMVLGVQCHPEVLWEETDQRWGQLFTGFIAAARTGRCG